MVQDRYSTAVCVGCTHPGARLKRLSSKQEIPSSNLGGAFLLRLYSVAEWAGGENANFQVPAGALAIFCFPPKLIVSIWPAGPPSMLYRPLTPLRGPPGEGDFFKF